MSRTVYIVPCSASKSPALVAGDCPARNAYAGQLFKLATGQLDAAGAKWFVLSGLYGFLAPDSQIGYYEQKLEPGSLTESDAFDQLWSDDRRALELADRVVVLGSRLYADAARQLLGREVESPIAGLPIGRMLQAVKSGDWLAAPSPPVDTTIKKHHLAGRTGRRANRSLPAKDRRSERVSSRVTKEEEKTLHTAANLAGKDFSEWVRETLLAAARPA